jgi:hypothetical protein
MRYNTLGDLFELAIQVGKADFELKRMIKELEYAEKKKERKEITAKIKKYLETPN